MFKKKVDAKRGKVVVLAPHFGQALGGGMQTHIEFLKSLSVLRGSEFLPLGSSDSLAGRLRSLSQLLNPALHMKIRRASVLLINTSLYPASLIKIFILLSVQGFIKAIGSRHSPSISVFFHGGTMSEGARRICRSVLRVPRNVNYYFLSDLQKDIFTSIFTEVPSGRIHSFSNYSGLHEPITRRGHLAVDGQLTLLCVGRVNSKKGQYTACEAVRRINACQKYMAVQLSIVGDGPDLPKITSDFAQEIARKEIVIWGQKARSELGTFYSRADICLMPTSWPEGLPYVLIEAYSYGVPVIATGVGTLRDLVMAVDSKLLLIDDSPDQLCRAIEVLLEDPNMLPLMRDKAAQCFREKFSASRAEDFYTNLLASSTL